MEIDDKLKISPSVSGQTVATIQTFDFEKGNNFIIHSEEGPSTASTKDNRTDWHKMRSNQKFVESLYFQAKHWMVESYLPTSVIKGIHSYDSWGFMIRIKSRGKRWNVKRSRVTLALTMGNWTIGGYDGESNLSIVEIYAPQTDTWTFIASMVCHGGGVGAGVIPNS